MGVSNPLKVTPTQKKPRAYLILARLPTIGVTILGLVDAEYHVDVRSAAIALPGARGSVICLA